MTTPQMDWLDDERRRLCNADARRMQRVRAHVSARRDPFYAELRKAGKL